MEGIRDHGKAKAKDNQVSKRYYQSEVQYLLQEISSWRKELFRGLTNIVDSHVNIITEGINNLSDKVGDLNTSLAVITQERDELQSNINELKDENSNLKATIVQSLTPADNIAKQESLIEYNEMENEEEESKVHIPRPVTEVQETSENAEFSETQQDNEWLNNKFNENIVGEHHFVKDKHKTYSHKCNQCDYVSIKMFNLIQHIKDVHDKIKDYKCEMCGYAASRKDTLKLHRMSVHNIGEKRYKCKHCHNAYYKSFELRSHMLVHDKKKIRYLSCEYCGDQFLRKSNLVSHKERCINKLSDEVGDIHPKPAVIREERNESQLIVKELKDESRDYETAITQPLTSTELTLKQDSFVRCSEIESEAQESKKVIPISVIDVQEQSNNTNLTEIQQDQDKPNNKSVENVGERSLKCDECDYVSIRISHFEQHIKEVHDKIKDHICEICGYATSRKNNLKQHKRSFHKMEEKGFKCNHCHYATYRMCDLRRHMSVHNRTRPREVRCEYCSCTFSEKTNLKKHKEKFHKKYDKTQVEDDIDIVKDEPFSLE